MKKKKKTFITLQLSFTTTFIFSTPFLTPFFPFSYSLSVKLCMWLEIAFKLFHSTVPMHDFLYHYTRNNFFIFLKQKKHVTQLFMNHHQTVLKYICCTKHVQSKIHQKNFTDLQTKTFYILLDAELLLFILGPGFIC
jgi:hypothetical protein